MLSEEVFGKFWSFWSFFWSFKLKNCIFYKYLFQPFVKTFTSCFCCKSQNINLHSIFSIFIYSIAIIVFFFQNQQTLFISNFTNSFLYLGISTYSFPNSFLLLDMEVECRLKKQTVCCLKSPNKTMVNIICITLIQHVLPAFAFTTATNGFMENCVHGCTQVHYTAWKVSVFRDFLVSIFMHSDHKNSKYRHFSRSASCYKAIMMMTEKACSTKIIYTYIKS